MPNGRDNTNATKKIRKEEERLDIIVSNNAVTPPNIKNSQDDVKIEMPSLSVLCKPTFPTMIIGITKEIMPIHANIQYPQRTKSRDIFIINIKTNEKANLREFKFTGIL